MSWAERLALVWFAAIFLLPLGALLYRATLLYSWSHNDGFNAYNAANIATLGRLYYPADSWLGNNYPPLSFLAVHWLRPVIPDAVLAGRFLGTIGLLGSFVLIGAVIHRLFRDAAAAVAAALVFIGYFVANLPGYVGADEPQLVAGMLMLAGLLAAVGGRAGRGGVVLAALLMTAGLFVKHNTISLPLALAIWLLMVDRRAALVFVGTGLAAGAIGLALCSLAYGLDFWLGMMTPRTWDVTTGIRVFLHVFGPAAALIVVAVAPAALRWRHPAFAPFMLYLVIALAVGAGTSLSRGLGANLFFDVVMAIALGAGYTLAAWPRGREAGGRPMPRAAAIALLPLAIVVNPGLWSFKDLWMPGALMAEWRAREADTRRVVARIAAAPGDALCDVPVLCYWAGKRNTIEPFIYASRRAAGWLDDGPLVARIAARGFGIIETYDAPPEPEVSVLSPAVSAAIDAHYRVLDAPSYPGVRLLVPKSD
jgi:hypothetical protein